MFRGLRRWFSDTETRKLAQECDDVLHRIADLGLRVEALQLRVDRHLNKIQMRDTRAARGGLSAEDRAILDDLKAEPGYRDPFN